MAESIINIKIQAKDDPTVNISVIEAGSVSGASNLNPSIQYVATGGIGPTGDTGATGSVSAEDSVVQANMATNSVGTPEIIDSSVTHAKIANGAIYGNKILDDSVSGSKLSDGSISGDKLQNNSVDASKIADGAITQELLELGVISRDQIEDKSITAGQIANNTIVRDLYVDNSIDGNKIEDNVTLAGTVTVNHLELEGSSPALIEGPAGDDINIKTHDQLNIQNTSGSTIVSFDQSGNLSLSGTVDGIDIATDVAANTLKLGISTSQANEITANTAKVGITPSQASAITVNTSKTSFPGFGTTSSTSLEGDTTTISTEQASAITANTAKTGITTSQANAITANTAKPDLTVDGAGTVHSNNYTDTVYTHPDNHAISVITGLQTALDSKQDGIGSEDLTIAMTDGLQDALDAKVDDSQVLTNVPANAVFTDTNTTYSVQDGELSQNNFTDADHTKLNGIEASADVTDAANVTAAGALMDSELTDLAGVKGVTISTLQVKPSEGAFANGDKTKLDSIEASATADQTKADIDALGIAATTAVSLTAGNKTIDGDLIIGGYDGDSHYITRFPNSDNDGGRLYVQAGNAGGTNKSGGSLILNAGLGTGAANGGSVIFQSSVVGSSGSTVNNQALTAILDSSGTLYLEGALTVKGDIIKSNAGTVFTFDSSGNTTIANTLNATLTGNVTGDVTGNSDTATALTSGDKTIEGNLRLGGTGDTGNNWISIDAQSGNDSSGGGITFFETGTYDVDSPQYGAKIVYNETADEFAIGTMHNNVFMRQIYFKRSIARTYFNGDLQIRDSSPAITIIDTSTTVASGDVVGVLNFSNEDDDGSTLRLQAVATEDHASGANGGTKLEIKTTPNGSSAEAVALTVGEDKSLTIEGDTSVAGDLTVNGSVNKSFQQFNLSFTDDISNLQHYLSWRDQYETSTSNYADTVDTNYLVPANGRVKCVYIRVGSRTSTRTMTVRVYSQNAGFQQSQVLQEAEATTITSSDDFEVFAFYFDAAEHFQAGDSIKISVQDSADSGGTQIYNVTAVLEFDYTQMGRTTSGELA